LTAEKRSVFDPGGVVAGSEFFPLLAAQVYSSFIVSDAAWVLQVLFQ
jgi:hypothetical protein